MTTRPPGGRRRVSPSGVAGVCVTRVTRGWCLCSSAARPAYNAHWVALADRTLAITLLGPCGARQGLLCWSRAGILCRSVLCDSTRDLAMVPGAWSVSCAD